MKLFFLKTEKVMEMLMVLEDFYDKDEFLEYYDCYRIHKLTVANINN